MVDLAGLVKNRTVVELDLSGADRIGTNGFKHVADMLCSTKQLKTLKIGYVGLRDI